MSGTMQIGFLEGFDEGRPAILMLGCAESLSKLAADLRALTGGEGGVFVVTEAPYVQVRGHLVLRARRVSRPSDARGVVRVVRGDDPVFDWLMDRDMLEEVVEKLDLLIKRFPPGGHQYLYSLYPEDGQVVVSVAECSPDVLERAV